MPKRSTALPLASPAPWRSFVVACKKCGKKLGGGFGPDGTAKLGRAVKAALRESGQRQALRVIETSCLGLCPKDAVAVMRADRPGEMLAVPAGMDGSALVAHLLPGEPPTA